MAFSQITIHHGNIGGFFQARPLGGTAQGNARGFGHGDALAVASRMAEKARSNARTRFRQRTGNLVDSVRPVVRQTSHGTLVGVSTSVEQGKWLEVGTDPHMIIAKNAPVLASEKSNPTPLSPPYLRKTPWAVEHPGSKKGMHWMSDAVRAVIPGAVVQVRTFG